jgi:DNA-binding transcriptional LysR family regulator
MTAPCSPSPPPIDLRDLHLVRTVARHGSITRAGAEIGLTQSALTRQIQAIESRLELLLFDRTTRRLEPTAAARFLLDETAGLSGQLADTVRRLREQATQAAREVRIGLSRSVALAHLPGLLHAHQRRSPEVRTTVAHLDPPALLTSVQDASLDLAILGAPDSLASTLQVTHRMADAFVLVGHPGLVPPALGRRAGHWPKSHRDWLQRQPWLRFSLSSSTGRSIEAWMHSHHLHPTAVTELDSFDMMVHLAALGFGVGLVPRRALAAFPRRKRLLLIPLPETFTRELIVVTRRSPAARSPHVQAFVQSILFS